MPPQTSTRRLALIASAGMFLTSMRILYVENHAVFAAQVSQQFLSAHSVRIVPSVAAAPDALAAADFDLLIVDYDLDDGKGDEIVRACRISHPHIKIIAASSHDVGNATLMETGAHAVCGKMEFDKIQQMINDLYAGACEKNIDRPL